MVELRFLDIDEAGVLQYALQLVSNIYVHVECASAPFL